MANNSKTSNKNIIWIICGVAIAIVGVIIGIIIALNASNGSGDDGGGDNGGSSNSSSSGELVVADSGWTYVQSTMWGNSVWYGVAIRNDNKGKVASFPKVKVVARSADDKILFSDEFTCSLDYAYYGETLYCGGHYGQQTEKPAKVEFKTSLDEWEDESAVNYPRNTDFVIKNTSEKKDDSTITYTGEIYNNSKTKINSAHIVVIFKKDGKIVGGDMSFSDKLEAGSDDTFQMYVSDAPEYDEYVITAQVAMIN